MTKPLNRLDEATDTMHYRHGREELTTAYGLGGDSWAGGGGGGSHERGGGIPPPADSSPTSAPKAFPYPSANPNRISNRQLPPPTAFTVLCKRSVGAAEWCPQPPSPSSKAIGRVSWGGGGGNTEALLKRHLCPRTLRPH